MQIYCLFICVLQIFAIPLQCQVKDNGLFDKLVNFSVWLYLSTYLKQITCKQIKSD